MLKKIISILTAIIVLFSLNLAAFTADSTSSTTAMRMEPLVEKLQGLSEADIQAGISKYSDVKKHWASNYIGKLTMLEVTGGGGKGTFNPNGEMSVAAFIKMVTVSLGYKISPSSKIGTQWYDTYIAQAKKDKLIDNGDFTNYTKAITREQASKILYRAAMMFLPAPRNQNEVNVMKFRIKDYAKIGDKYKDFFVKAYYMGFFTLGTTSVCNPKGTFTRAQACTVVYRLLDSRERPAFVTQEGEYYISSYDGTKQYPVGSLENVKAINYLDRIAGKSTGYADRQASAPLGSSYNFYESKDEFETMHVTGVDLGIDIHDDGSPVHNNWVCDVIIFNSKATKEKHLKVIEELAKYYFESKYSNAMTQINKALAGNNSEYMKEYKMNDRYLIVHYVDDSGISIGITCKGGLTRSEYMKKYTN